jgi:protoporphyrin/coproporphyrin ferrochelatase
MSDVLPGTGRLAHAPANHPPVKRAKIGVLLANLGTPDNIGRCAAI